jgi:hypothetical protein
MPTAVDFSYLAGIIDGEGTITVSRQPRSTCRRPYFCPRVLVSNTSEALMTWIAERFPVGRVRVGRYSPSKGGKKAVYRWDVENRALRPLLKRLLPYLVVKRRNAELLLEWVQPSDTWPGPRADGKKYNRSQRRKLGVVGLISEEMYAEQTRIFTEVRALNAAGGKVR